MVKINENEVIISRHELYVLVGAASACEIRENQLEKYDLAFMNFAATIYCRIAWHIWEGKKLPEKSTEFLLNMITPEGTEKKEQKLESYEGMCSICKLLLIALQKTRAFHNLTDLKYSTSEVTAKFLSGSRRIINVEADSGIAMIRDIVTHL